MQNQMRSSRPRRHQLRDWYASALSTQLRLSGQIKDIKRGQGKARQMRGRQAVIERAREIDLLRREQEIKNNGATIIAWAREDGFKVEDLR